MSRLLAFLVVSLIAVLPVRAENLITGLSFDEINITSDFNGTTLLVFGTVDKMSNVGGERTIEDYDIFVSIEGPRAPQTIRRKERIAGIWINGASVDYLNMPASYLLVGSRESSDPAVTDTLKELGVGLDNLSFGRMPGIAALREGDVFNEAVVRLKSDQALFNERVAIEPLGENLFRARFNIPPLVPVGEHVVTTHLMYQGETIASTTMNLAIKKIGFEQFMYEIAHEYGYLYGIVAVLVAMVTGWLGSVLFRRD